MHYRNDSLINWAVYSETGIISVINTKFHLFEKSYFLNFSYVSVLQCATLLRGCVHHSLISREGEVTDSFWVLKDERVRNRDDVTCVSRGAEREREDKVLNDKCCCRHSGRVVVFCGIVFTTRVRTYTHRRSVTQKLGGGQPKTAIKIFF